MKSVVDFSVFRRNRNFLFLYLGQFISFLGTAITGVALPYQIYTETHSTLMVGLLSLAQLLPLLVTALVGGVFADRYHRRFLLLSAESVMAVGALLLALNANAAQAHLALIFIVSALMSGFNGLHRPALDSMTQQIVMKADFATVSSMNMFKMSVCLIGGPAVGGLLIAHTGLVTTYLVDFSTFLVSLLALLCIRGIPKPEGRKDMSTVAALRESFQYAVSRQELIGTYVVDFVAMIFGMPSALFPAIAQSFGGVKVLGLLYAAPAVGALLLSFFSGWVRQVSRHGAAVAVAAALWGLAIIGFGLSPTLWLALAFLVVAGAFDAISGIFRGIIWNETIPNALRGRMAGIEMISYLSGPKLGDTEAGLVAAAFGVTASIVSGGMLCVVGVAVCCWCLPRFWHYRGTSTEESA